MPRFSGWRRLSGDTADRPDLLDAGKRLLGYIAEQRRLSGVSLLSAQLRTADGSLVRARFVGDIPVIEVSAAETGLPESPPVATQGFTVRPDGAGPSDLDDILLIPGSALDDGSRGWLAMFYDADHAPDPAPTPAGIYGKNKQNETVFPDGLSVNGNLDWRNADETMVVTFFGPEDRYFQRMTNTHTPGRGTISFSSPFSTLVMINGGVVFDYADHPLFNQRNDVVMGACVRDGQLVVCISGINADTSDPYLRFYIAPLVRDEVSKWATVPVKFGPRFARIAADDMALLYEEEFALNDDFYNHQIFAFNQSATEGRILVWNSDNTIEVVFDFADLDHPSLTQTTIDTRRVTVLASNQQMTQTIVANAYSMGTRAPDGGDPGTDDDISYGWGFAGRPYRIKDFSYSLDITLEVPSGPCAVDYKDDVPVYAYTNRGGAVFPRTESGTYTANPTMTPAVPASYGSAFESTNEVTEAWQSADVDQELVLPWGKTLTTGSTYIRSGSGTAEASFQYNSSGVLLDASIDNQSSSHSVGVEQSIVPLYCDLRKDTIIYGLVVSTLTVDNAWASVDSGVTPSIKVSITDTTTQRLVRTLQLFAHINGEDVAAGEPQTIYDNTAVTNAPVLASITSIEDAVRRGHQIHLSPQGPSRQNRILPGNVSVEDGAFSVTGTLNTTYAAALRALIVAPDHVGQTTPIDVSPSYDTGMGPPTYAAPNPANLSAEPVWPQGGLATPTLSYGWLFGPTGSFTPVMPWGVQTITYKIPTTTDGVFYQFTRRTYGGYQVLRDAYAFCLPWPDGVTERFNSVLAGADFTPHAGYDASTANFPISITSRFLYGK